MNGMSVIENSVRTGEVNILMSSDRKESAAMSNVISEAGENFYSYIERQGLTNEPNLLILSARHHYFYDDSEMEAVTTLVDLKKLNAEKNLRSYVSLLNNVLSPGTDFVGYFSDRENERLDNIFARMYRKMINFLDAKVDNYIDRREIKRLFEANGLKIVDMTDINGLTYFRTSKMALSA
jgi:hypothetical protein